MDRYRRIPTTTDGAFPMPDKNSTKLEEYDGLTQFQELGGDVKEKFIKVAPQAEATPSALESLSQGQKSTVIVLVIAILFIFPCSANVLVNENNQTAVYLQCFGSIREDEPWSAFNRPSHLRRYRRPSLLRYRVLPVLQLESERLFQHLLYELCKQVPQEVLGDQSSAGYSYA